MKIFLTLLYLLISCSAFAQSDTIAYNTSKIFYITIKDANKSIISFTETSTYKEVYIDTLSRDYLIFDRKTLDSENPMSSRKSEKIKLEDILVLGYKNGTHEELGLGIGAAVFGGTGFILGVNARKQDQLYNDKNPTKPMLTALIGLVVGAGTGYLLGGMIDSYKYFPLPSERDKKYDAIIKIINDGIRQNK